MQEDEDKDTESNSLKIEDILKGRDKKHHKPHVKPAYTLQKTTFNV